MRSQDSLKPCLNMIFIRNQTKWLFFFVPQSNQIKSATLSNIKIKNWARVKSGFKVLKGPRFAETRCQHLFRRMDCSTEYLTSPSTLSLTLHVNVYVLYNMYSEVALIMRTVQNFFPLTQPSFVTLHQKKGAESNNTVVSLLIVPLSVNHKVSNVFNPSLLTFFLLFHFLPETQLSVFHHPQYFQLCGLSPTSSLCPR